MDGPRTSKGTSRPKEVKASLKTVKHAQQYEASVEKDALHALGWIKCVFGLYIFVDFFIRETYVETADASFARLIRPLAIAFFVIMMFCTLNLYETVVTYLVLLYGDKIARSRILIMTRCAVFLFCCAVAAYSYWATYLPSPSGHDLAPRLVL